MVMATCHLDFILVRAWCSPTVLPALVRRLCRYLWRNGLLIGQLQAQPKFNTVTLRVGQAIRKSGFGIDKLPIADDHPGTKAVGYPAYCQKRAVNNGRKHWSSYNVIFWDKKNVLLHIKELLFLAPKPPVWWVVGSPEGRPRPTSCLNSKS